MARSILKPLGCYVYTHRKASTGEIFYVGKGTAERAWDRYGRSAYWQRIAAKHGVVVHIESEGLLEFEAHAQECEMIIHLRRQGVRLANLTDGGEGGLNPSPETRAKIGAAHKGKPKSAEHIEKIRLGNLGKKRSPEVIERMRQRVHSDQSRAKMSESGMRRPPMSAETLQKIREASLKNWGDPVYRATVLLAVTGKTRDSAFSQKMAEIMRARPPRSAEENDLTRAAMLAKWQDAEYRERMSSAHAGKGWSEARREAFKQGEAQRRADSFRRTKAKKIGDAPIITACP